DGELCHSDGVGSRRVHHDDALASGGVSVDVIDANSGASYDTELRGGLEELCVCLNGGADDEGVCVGELGGEAILDLVRRDDLPAGLLLEDCEGSRGDFFSENDLHGVLLARFGRLHFYFLKRAMLWVEAVAACS